MEVKLQMVGKKASSCLPVLLCQDYIQRLELLRDWLADFYIWLYSDSTYKLDEGFYIFLSIRYLSQE